MAKIKPGGNTYKCKEEATLNCLVCHQSKEISEFYSRTDNLARQKRCKECSKKYEKARTSGNKELMKKYKQGRKLVDYKKIKVCKTCGVLKEHTDYPKNGKRTKNSCKLCASIRTALKNSLKVYTPIVTAFTCRTCGVLVSPEEVYIENTKNNKPSTQCKTCYLFDAQLRKAKRRAKLKNARINNSKAEEKDIRLIYKKCKQLNVEAGEILWNVDHIKPLSKGGSHHPSNLQIIGALENKVKGAKYVT